MDKVAPRCRPLVPAVREGVEGDLPPDGEREPQRVPELRADRAHHALADAVLGVIHLPHAALST